MLGRQRRAEGGPTAPAAETNPFSGPLPDPLAASASVPDAPAHDDGNPFRGPLPMNQIDPLHGKPPSNLGTVAMQFPVGLDKAIANVGGAPVDLANWALGRIFHGQAAPAGVAPGYNADGTPDLSGVMGGPGAAAAPTKPLVENPVGGSQSIKDLMGGASPDKHPANTPLERIVSAAGEGAGSMIVPEGIVGMLGRTGAVAPRTMEALQSTFGRAKTLPGVASNAAIGATAGATGEAAAEVVPDKYKPFAQMAGNLLGGGSAALLNSGARWATGVGTKAIGDLARPFVGKNAPVLDEAGNPLTNDAGVALQAKPGQLDLAASQLRGAATDRGAAIDALDTGGQQLVPGSKPTTFQASGDMGLGALEKTVASSDNDTAAQFNQRRADQNSARLSAISNAEPLGNPTDVAQFVTGHLRSIDDMSQSYLDAATRDAQAKASAIGPGLTPEAHGALIREAAAGARVAAKKNERGLWDAVDPDGTLTMPADPITTKASGLTDIPPTAKPIQGEELGIFNTAQNLPSIAPFSDITALRSRVSTAMKEERRTSGETPTYARLAQLRGSIEDAISGAVTNKAASDQAAVAAGTMAPQDTTEAVIKGWVAEHYAKQNALATNRIGAGSDTVPGTAGASRSSGTAGQVGRGIGNNASPQGIPGQALPPNIDQAAAARLTAASAATKARAQTFDQGPVGGILKSRGMAGDFATPDSGVPGNLFKQGPGGFENVEAYRKALSPGEKVGSPAVVVNGKIYKGENHWEALNAAAKENTDAQMADYVGEKGDLADGFVTTAGRFVSRQDAAKIALARGQVPPEAFAGLRSQGREPGLKSEDIAQYPGAGTDHLADVAADSMRKAATAPDGTIDPKKLADWQSKYSDAMRAFPQLQAQFGNAAKATETMGNIAAARKTALDQFQQGTVGKLIGVTDPTTVKRTIGSIFGQRDAVPQMQRLANLTARDPDARAGLRRAIVEHMSDQFVGNTEAATSGQNLMKADAFQTFLRKNQPVLGQVFSPEEMQNLNAIAADLHRSNRSVTAVKLPGGSDTTQKLRSAAAHDVPSEGSLLTKIIGAIAVTAELGPVAGASALGGALGSQVIGGMRNAGLRHVNDLVKEAMLNPDLAKTLLMRAPIAAGRGSAISLAQQLGRVSMLSAASGKKTDRPRLH